LEGLEEGQTPGLRRFFISDFVLNWHQKVRFISYSGKFTPSELIILPDHEIKSKLSHNGEKIIPTIFIVYFRALNNFKILSFDSYRLIVPK